MRLSLRTGALLLVCASIAACEPRGDLTSATIVDLSHAYDADTIFWPTDTEGFVLEELELALAAWNERQLAPSIRALQDWIGETIANAMDEMAAEGLQTLNQEDRERLARRVAHVPVKGLRALARAYGPEAARVFLAETGLAR